MTQIWYEVFPVTLINRNVMLLQDATRSRFSPWMLPHQPNTHPNTLVIDYLSRLLGGLVCANKTIVHSTSWRYEATQDQVLLTYLAILPQGNWKKRMQRSGNINIETIGAITAQHGENLFTPKQNDRSIALAHSLFHLASLNTYDLMIQTALEAEWQEILQTRQPKPAGCLQRVPVL